MHLVYNSVPYIELIKLYKSYDIAIHTESFSLKNKLRTRLSFSTKFIDCLTTGCVLLAFLPSINAGFQTIQSNQIGLCVSNKNELEKTLIKIKNNEFDLSDVAKRSVEYCTKYHWQSKNSETISKDFITLVNGKR